MTNNILILSSCPVWNGVYNKAMYDFHPYFTNDGSVGLYSPDFDDIYHSSTGALTEAYEKFIMPINVDEILKKDSIKIGELLISKGADINAKDIIYQNII